MGWWMLQSQQEGTAVSFQLSAMWPASDIQDVLDNLTDEEIICDGPEQRTWGNEMSMANFRGSGGPVISLRPKVNIPITLLPRGPILSPDDIAQSPTGSSSATQVNTEYNQNDDSQCR